MTLDYDGWLVRGAAALREGRLDHAVAAYRAAAMLRPADPGVHVQLAQVLHRVGLIEATRQSYLRAVLVGAGTEAAVEAAAAVAGLPPAPAARENFPVGRVLHSVRQRVFEIVDVRTGGFGVVYIVREQRTNATRAIKTFHAGLLWSDDDRRRFELEAATWLEIPPHPNVVRAESVDEISGCPCLLLEYVDGGDLRTVLAAEGPLAAARAADLAAQFCDGMIHATRDRDLVHRDVKPGNCLLGSDGTLKITDFGLARVFAEPVDLPDRVDLGRSGEVPPHLTTIAGTPAYMAPEQFEVGAVLDTRVDVYAFGVMLHQMLTGATRIAGSRSPKWPWRGREARLLALARDCAAPDRVDRPGSFADVRAALAAIVAVGPATIAAPVDAQALLERAIGLKNLGRLDDAFTAVREGQRVVAPDRTVLRGHLWQVLGRVLDLQGRHDEALDAHDRSVELNPDESSAWVARGRTLNSLGRHDEAVSCYDRAVELRPHDGYNWQAHADGLLALDRFEDALRSARRAVALVPDDDLPAKSLTRALHGLGRLDEALAAADRLLAISPRSGLGWGARSEILQEMGRLDDALDAADRCVEIEHTAVGGWLRRAHVLLTMTRYSESLAAFDRALAVAPDRGWTWHGRGGVLWLLRRYPEAVDSSERAARLEPGEPTILAVRDRRREQAPVEMQVLANEHLDAGDLDGAEQLYEAILATGHPAETPHTLRNLALLHTRRGDLTAAEAFHRRSIGTGHPDVAPQSMIGLGMVLEQRGDRIGAARSYQEASETGHPRAAPWGHYHYGRHLHAEGDTAGAVRCYRVAVAQTTNEDAAGRARVDLEALEPFGDAGR